MEQHSQTVDLKSEYKKHFSELQSQVMTFIFSAKREDCITAQAVLEAVEVPHKEEQLKSLYTNYITRVLGVFARDGFLSRKKTEGMPLKEQSFYRTSQSFHQQGVQRGYVKLREVSMVRQLEQDNIVLKENLNRLQIENRSLQDELVRLREILKS